MGLREALCLAGFSAKQHPIASASGRSLNSSSRVHQITLRSGIAFPGLQRKTAGFLGHSCTVSFQHPQIHPFSSSLFVI